MKTLLTSIERVPWLEDVCTLPWIYPAGVLWEGVHPTSLACADSQSHQLSGRMHRDIHSRHPLILGWLGVRKERSGHCGQEGRRDLRQQGERVLMLTGREREGSIGMGRVEKARGAEGSLAVDGVHTQSHHVPSVSSPHPLALASTCLETCRQPSVSTHRKRCMIFP